MTTSQPTSHKKSILLGTTAPVSLGFLRGFPEYLRTRGWTVHVVSSSGPELVEYQGNELVELHTISMARDPHPLSDAIAFMQWLRLLRKVKPDMVVVGTPKAALLAMVAARMLSVPGRVYHLWGLRVETTTGLARAVLTAAEWLTCASATRVLVVSPSLGRAVLEARLTPRKKVDLLEPGSSHGIDLDYFDPSQSTRESVEATRRSLGIDEGDIVVGYVGRIHPDKGIDYLVEAMTILTAKLGKGGGGDENRVIRLLVVGDNDHDRYSPFAKVAFPVSLVGQVNDTRPFYRLMDVLCLPTLREGLPNVPLEAAAMGVPVITTTATGARDSISDGVTGLLVPPRDALALAEALESLVADPGQARLMGDEGKRWVRRFERSEIWSLHERYYARHAESIEKR